MAKQAGTDRMARDIREDLKRIATTSGRYFTGTAKLFLASSAEVVGQKMPTVGSMLDANRDFMNDTMKFLRNPVDAVHRGIDRALNGETLQAAKKLAADALDDLKTGNFYDPNRDRSEFGTNIDNLLDNFGDVDMSGFDAEGEYEEPDLSGFDHDENLLESHEEADDARTIATIGAIRNTGDAIVSNQKYNAQMDVRMGIKQHSQLMSSMSNVITQQGALLESVNAAASSILEVNRASHQEIVSILGDVTQLLSDIKTLQEPASPTEYDNTPDSIYGDDGALDIRKWLSAARKSVDQKYGISDMISAATVGMSPKALMELFGDNPLMLISNMMVEKVLPEYLKKTMETTQGYLQNFFPSLLANLAERGRRFDKDPSEGGGRLIDAIAGIFGVQPKNDAYLNLRPSEISGKAIFTNRTATAIEKVIPMWLSKIYSAVSDDPLSMWDYSRGEMASVTKTVSDTYHSTSDLAGRMGDGMYTVMRKALDDSTYRWVDPTDKTKFEDYLYRFFQSAAQNGRMINPYGPNANLKDILPDDTNKELYSQLIEGVFRTLPRSRLMGLNKEINDARTGLSQATKYMSKDLKESGLDMAFAMLDPSLRSSIEYAAPNYRRGLSDKKLKELTDSNYETALAAGRGIKGAGRYLSDITSMLKRGIITYTHIIDDRTGNISGGGNSITDPVYKRIADESISENDKVQRIIDKQAKDEMYEQEWNQNRILDNRQKQRTDMSGTLYIDGNPDHMDDITATIAQANREIGQTVTGGSDNKTVEELRILQDRQNKIRGIAKGAIGNVSEVFNWKPNATFMDKVTTILDSPFKLVDLGLRTIDTYLFKVIYGEDAVNVPEVDENGNIANSDATSLMHTINRRMRAEWTSAKDWFKEYVGNPIKEFFVGENGILGTFKQRLTDRFIEPLVDKVVGIKDAAASKLLGNREIVEKYVDDPDHPGEKKLVKEKGAYSGGILSGALNKINNKKQKIETDLKQKKRSFIDNLMYGENVEGKGVSHSLQQVGTRKVKNSRMTRNGMEEYEEEVPIWADVQEFSGIMGKLKEGAQTVRGWLFGEDEDGNDHDSWNKYNMVKDEFKKAFPDMTIGAGIGLVGSLFLPGGPIVGSILGAAGGLVAGSDKLKNYLFGEEEEEHEITKYNWKTGEIETVKGKGRKGGVVDSRIQDAFKKFAPKMTIGAGIGALTGMFLPGGPVVGAILGASGGMAAASDRIKEMIFGDAESDDSGLISRNTRKKLVDVVKKNAPGIIGGAAGGAKLGSMLGAGLGLIPGMALLPTGPIFTLLGGITGAIGGNTIQEMFFGKEEEVEEPDPKDPTKTIKKKRRVGGLFGKAFDGVKKKVDGFGDKLSSIGDKVGDWFKSDVLGPISNSMQPLKDAATNAKNTVEDAFRNMGNHIKNSLDTVFNSAFGGEDGIKGFWEEKVKKPLSNMTNKILSGIGKAIGAVLSAPFKLVSFMLTGSFGVDKDVDLDSNEEANDTPKRKRKKFPGVRKAASGLLDRFVSWRDKGTEESNENMKETLRYWEQPDVEHEKTDRELADEAYANAMKQERSSREKRKASRKAFVGKIKDKWNRFVYGDEEEEQSEEQEPTAPKKSWYEQFKEDNAARRADRQQKKAEKDEARKKRREDDLERKAKKKEDRQKKREDAHALKEERADNIAQDASANKDVKEGSKKTRNAASYLKSIDHTVTKIYKEIKGQFNGVAWNVAYIKASIDKSMGKGSKYLSDDELPENMEGSNKRVKKRRGLFGRAIDHISDAAWFVKDKAIGAKDAIVDKVTGLVDGITKPFKALGGAVKGATKAIGSFGSFVFDIIGKIGRGMAEGIAKAVAGAGSMIGRAFAGLGRMIWNAGKGLGKAVGNAFSLVTDVVKNVAGGLMAGASALWKMAMDVAPDIAHGIWSGIKFVGKGVWKGIKGVGKLGVGAVKGVAGGVKKAWNLVRGKKDPEKQKADSLHKISEAIHKGLMGMGIGSKDDIKPYPWVKVTNGKIADRLNSYAIPVYVLGGSLHTRLDDEDYNQREKPFTGKSSPNPFTPSNEELKDSRYGFGTVPVGDTDERAKFNYKIDTESPFGVTLGLPKDADEYWRKWSKAYDHENGLDTPEYKKLVKQVEKDRKDIEKRSKKRKNASVLDNVSDQVDIPPQEPVRPESISRIENILTKYLPPIASDISEIKNFLFNADFSSSEQGVSSVNQSTKTEMVDKKKFEKWKEGYKKVDTKAEQSKNPGEIYDEGIRRATNMEQAEGILAASQMNSNTGLINITGGGKGSSGEDEGGGLFETLFGGGDGVLDTKGFFSTLLGGGGLGAAFRSLFRGKKGKTPKTGKSGGFMQSLKEFFVKDGKLDIQNAAFTAGTIRAIANDDKERVITNVAKEASTKGASWLTKVLDQGTKLSNGEIITDQVTSAKGGSKFVMNLKNGLDNIAKNGIEWLGKISPDANKAVQELAESGSKGLGKSAASLTSEAGQAALKTFGSIVKIASTVADASTGMDNANNINQTTAGDTTQAQRQIGALSNVVSGLTFGLIRQEDIQGKLQKVTHTEANTDDQDVLKQIVANFNRQTGQNLTVDEYLKNYNDDGTKKDFGDWLSNLGANATNAVILKPASDIALAGNSIANAWRRLTGQETKRFDRDYWEGLYRKNLGAMTNEEVLEAQANGTYRADVDQAIRAKEYSRLKVDEVIQWMENEGYFILKKNVGNTVYYACNISTWPSKHVNLQAQDSTGYVMTEKPIEECKDFDTWRAANLAPEDNAKIDEKIYSTGKGRGWGTGRVNPMNQMDTKWNKFSDSIGKVGCGPTVAAMIGSAYGDKSTPADADALSKSLGMRASDGGTDPGFFGRFAKGKGYGMTEGPTDPNRIAGSLKKGNPVALMGEGGAFGKNMHYMVADSISGKGKVGLVDPIGGVRKSVDMDALTKNTKDTIYSFGKGPVSLATGDGGGTTDTESTAEKTKRGQKALVDWMAWLSEHPIEYSLSGAQNPDKGSASCASTVGWAYRKALGIEGMSASSSRQSEDSRFSTIYVKDKSDETPPLDLLQPGDIMYLKPKDKYGNYTYDDLVAEDRSFPLGHTEMYAGDGQDLSHGGPNKGPVYKDLTDWRKKRIFMVRRYKPFLEGTDIPVINDDKIGSRASQYGSFGSNASGVSLGALSSGIILGADGTRKLQLNADGSFDFFNSLDTVFGDVATKLGNVVSNVMGISTGDSSGDNADANGSTDQGSKTDPSFTPVAGGKVDGNSYTAIIYNYLRKKGLTPEAASGLMGNLWAESGADPTNVQNYLYDKELAKTQGLAAEDAKYLADVENGTHDFTKDSIGYGIAQWTYSSRKKELQEKAKAADKSVSDINVQLQHLWDEINSYGLAGKLNEAGSVKAASDIILHEFEAPKDQGPDVEQLRAGYGQQWYDEYANAEKPLTDEEARAVTNEEAWGTGPSGESMALNAMNAMVENINTYLREANDARDQENTITAITDKITNAVAPNAGKDDALLQTLTATMGQMVELLAKIADNTKKTDEPDPLNGGRTRARTIPKIEHFPTAFPTSENNTADPTRVGASIVNQMISNRR